ncbi:DUF305 domain-containing protein [Arthrobacter sp. SRS-W-1-2016]|uniref:DUF305 domain-containing protein n=1 Tax=Arthrobacter sp. SRS-W-1-2016 TaxID=1930254 RepID=UPI000990A78A|nr:DUF305 domain-containing protein [Arthrobacter sp. SRS-W-1-2016]OOP60939.1 DUF305 domain-containing protein [Arthrobacter sp. SRS-W-1-2016]
MKKILTISAASVATVLALAGCSGGTGGSMPGMSHDSSAMASGSAPVAAGDHSSDDTMFAQSMIPHHAQAVDMSDTLLKKQNIPAAVTALATRIKAAQAPEIDKMTAWLQSWNESATMSASHSMTGMMGTDDMAKLDAAQGTEAAKLFLTQMIAHHQGAVAMAKTEAAAGKNSGAVALAKSIVASQEAEIQEMKNLLATF